MGQRENLSSGKILIIDDSRTNLIFLSNILENEGYEIFCATDGMGGMLEVRQKKPQLILLDVDMPDMNGFEVCRLLKEDENTQSIPVIFISAMDEVEDKIKGFESGGVDYVTKPFQLEEIIMRVKTHLTLYNLQNEIKEAGRRDWQATFHAVNEAIFLTDEGGNITDCNKAAQAMFDLPERGVLNGFIGDYFFNDPIEVQDVLNLNGEIHFPRLEGWFDVSTYPLAHNGEQGGTVFIIENITERKQMENLMVSSQRMADLGALSAAITHELKSPLQVISWASESLLEKIKKGPLEGENPQASIAAIHESSERINEIILSLLNYARTSGNSGPQDFNAIIQDTLRLIEHQLKVWANIQVVVNLEDNLPLFICDRLKISQVLINLLMNARDAMPSGGKISIATHFLEAKHCIELEINDSGTGIPVEIQDKIFDQFFTTKPIGQGTGLGLYIVGSVVRAHGGEIKLESEPDQGATFRLLFPVYDQSSSGPAPLIIVP